MKASDFIAEYIKLSGVTHVYELVGGMITHLLDSVSKNTDINIVSCHHEQAAGFAAEGYARICGLPGIAFATSGPGATNLLTAIGSCYFDSTPTVFITGQVNTYELKPESLVRQSGFQETDIVAMAMPICKSAVQISTAQKLPSAIEYAFRHALEGRQGPCLLDIPMNVQSENIDDSIAWLSLQNASKACYPQPVVSQEGFSEHTVREKISQLLEAIQLSKKPLLLMGGGCSTKINRTSALKIANSLKVPVVLSLMAVDLLPESNNLRVGFIGSYGNRWANMSLGECDLLVVLGSRLDIKQTGSNLESFCNGKEIWHIDIDSAEIGHRVQAQQSICSSVTSFGAHLSSLNLQLKPHHLQWLAEIKALNQKFPATDEYVVEPGEINPISFLQNLSISLPSSCQYITDVGQHQMWAAQSLRFRENDRFITSGGMGAMGFGIPAAIGAAFARPDQLTILITGDGSFQLNIQELETLYRNQINLKIVLFNNNCHGMVRQFQESYFHGNLQSTVVGYSAPDFVAVCKAYRLQARYITSSNSIDVELDWLFRSEGPALLEVPLSIHSKVYPKLAFGRKFGEMEPEFLPISMEST